MARSRLYRWILAGAALVAATPALAQFDSIFRDDGPPRPPANVPQNAPYYSPEQQRQLPPSQAPYYPSQRDAPPQYVQPQYQQPQYQQPQYQQAPPQQQSSGGGMLGQLGTLLGGTTGPRGGHHEGLGEAMAKSAVRAMGSSVGRQLIRGVLGGLMGNSSRSR